MIKVNTQNSNEGSTASRSATTSELVLPNMLHQSYGGPCGAYALSSIMEVMRVKGQISGAQFNPVMLNSQLRSLQTQGESLINLVRLGLSKVNKPAIVFPSSGADLPAYQGALSKLGIQSELIDSTIEDFQSTFLDEHGALTTPVLVGYFPRSSVNEPSNKLSELQDNLYVNSSQVPASKRNSAMLSQTIIPHYGALTEVRPEFFSNGKLDPKKTVLTLQESGGFGTGLVSVDTRTYMTLEEFYKECSGAAPVAAATGFFKDGKMTALRVLPGQTIKETNFKITPVIGSRNGVLSGSIENATNLGDITGAIKLGANMTISNQGFSVSTNYFPAKNPWIELSAGGKGWALQFDTWGSNANFGASISSSLLKRKLPANSQIGYEFHKQDDYSFHVLTFNNSHGGYGIAANPKAGFYSIVLNGKDGSVQVGEQRGRPTLRVMFCKRW